MRLSSALLVLPLLLAVPACGSDSESSGPSAAPTTTAPTTTAPTTSAPAAGGTTSLTGTIGTTNNPEAFEIGLTTADGTEVETLPAGTYSIKVDDQSGIHNWHLTGDGVDVETGVGAKEVKTFEVTLKPGTYTFDCDPHKSSMTGTFTVT